MKGLLRRIIGTAYVTSVNVRQLFVFTPDASKPLTAALARGIHASMRDATARRTARQNYCMWRETAHA